MIMSPHGQHHWAAGGCFITLFFILNTSIKESKHSFLVTDIALEKDSPSLFKITIKEGISYVMGDFKEIWIDRKIFRPLF